MTASPVQPEPDDGGPPALMGVPVVSGSGTGVGKTVVTAAIAALAHARGEDVAVIKPAQTGVRPGEPGDLDEVRRLAGPLTVPMTP